MKKMFWSSLGIILAFLVFIGFTAKADATVTPGTVYAEASIIHANAAKIAAPVITEAMITATAKIEKAIIANKLDQTGKYKIDTGGNLDKGGIFTAGIMNETGKIDKTTGGISYGCLNSTDKSKIVSAKESGGVIFKAQFAEVITKDHARSVVIQ